MRRLTVAFLLAGCLVLGSAPVFATSAGFTAHDLVTMKRLSSPQVSPDGSWIVYVLRETDLEADRGRTDLWLIDTDGKQEPRRLTEDEGGDGHPRWAPDGKSVYYLNGSSGSSQVWNMTWTDDAVNTKRVTDLPLGVAGFAVSPDGEQLAVAMDVFVDCEDLQCTVDRLEAKENDKSSALAYDRLFMRHWDHWKDGRRSHVFVLPVAGGEPVDVTAGLDGDVPPKPFSGMEEVTFTPDSKGVVFSARVEGASEPWSTNFDLYQATIDGSEPLKRLTGNPAWDSHPAFSPDGKTLAYMAMERAGFEADRFRLILRDVETGEERSLTEAWDRSVGGFFFSPDGKTVYITAGDTGNVRLFAVDVDGSDAQSIQIKEVWGQGHVRSAALAESSDGPVFIFGLDDLQRPVDLYSLPVTGGEPKPLTAVNADALAKIDMGAYEQFSFKGWKDETVYGYVVKPAGFEKGKTYPVAFLIHGGPQGSFDNDFHYRWNPQTYAGAGYASVFIDFHGSTGYGQAFTDSITGDWGGKPLEDLQKGWAAALERYDWLDGDRACALGASYGGYMINWIAGKWPDGFDCLVNHDGLFNLESMYYSTEELWFPEWEMKGTPWQNPEGFNRHNPMRFVQAWKTPMLVIHGAKDYRVVDTEGIATFTALQRRGIPSRFLYFPDENHWVLKPANSIRWHEEVLSWLDRWTAVPASTEADTSN